MMLRRVLLDFMPMVVCLLTTPANTGAASLNVCPSGCTYSTIQSAVDSAVSGDVVQIRPGRYAEKVTVIDKRLTLVGSSGGELTEVIGSGHGPVFVLGSGTEAEYQRVSIQYLTIAQGTHQSGTGIGGGIQVRRGAYLYLSNSIIISNSALYGGGVGILTPGGPATTMVDCVISGNASTGFDKFGGGGVFVGTGSAATIRQTTITRNHAVNGGGLYTDAGSRATLDETTVSDNAVEQIHEHLGFIGGQGGGLNVRSSLSMDGSVIAGNSVSGQETAVGGGIYILLGGIQTIGRTIIAHNVASGPAGDGGGIFIAAQRRDEMLGLDHVYVVENEAAAGFAGGISNEGTLKLHSSVIADNSGANCKGGTGCPP